MTTSQKPVPLVATTVTSPRIYLACLAAYNGGRLHGAWIAADRGEDHIWENLRVMLSASPEPEAEEWAIHDYEGFEGCYLPESASFKTVCDLAEFINAHGEVGAKVYDYFSNDLDEARSAFDAYAGEYNCAAEFAEQLHDEIGTEIPASLQYCIDWESLARDMEINGEIMIVKTGLDQTHFFWSRK